MKRASPKCEWSRARGAWGEALTYSDPSNSAMALSAQSLLFWLSSVNSTNPKPLLLPSKFRGIFLIDVSFARLSGAAAEDASQGIFFWLNADYIRWS